MVPEEGYSLLECYKNLPQMKEFLGQIGIISDIVKCNMSVEVNERDMNTKMSLIIQPAPPPALHAVYDKIKFKQYRESTTDIYDFGDGCSISVKAEAHEDEEFEVPSSIQTESSCIYLRPGMESLNEFGMFYFALYILGNYARYFPDQWMRDVENYSAMALAADELLSYADHRLPLLTLSEMDRRVILPR